MRETIDPASDGDVVGRVLGGDRDAFEILIERHGDRVFEIVARRVPRDDTPEVAQDVFVRAYLSLPGYGGKGDFRAWLSKIAVRACFDYWREHYRHRERTAGTLGEDQEEWLDRALSERSGRVHEEETMANEARDVLAWALGKLSPEDRAVLELVHIEGRSVKEAAALLGWSTVNVKVRAFRSRKKLRAVLDGLIAEKEARHESA